jgi:preprotein translocase subunit SecG
MVFPVLAAASFVMQIVAVVFVFIAVALIIIVLVQKGKGGGLSSAFGGAGSSSVFGSKTGDFLTWTTISIAGLFLVLAVLMSRFYRPTGPQLGPDVTPPAQTAPAAAPTAPAPAQTTPAIPATPTAPVNTPAK